MTGKAVEEEKKKEVCTSIFTITGAEKVMEGESTL
jgi:hypothetical protein